MAGFRCKNCGFRTEREARGNKCPYCDRETIEREQDASELLDNTD